LNEKSTMRLSQRLIAATVFVALSAILAGCSSMNNFDPMDMLDFLDTKKKLPGERKPVFPEGVPGLEQGVPRDLYKGAQAQPDQNAQTATAAPPPVEEPRGKKSKGKKTRPAETAAPEAAQDPAAATDPNAAPADASVPSEAEAATEAAPPPPKPKKIVRRRTTAPPPDPQNAQPAQSAQPAQRAAPAQQQSAAPFPAPLPSSTFQR
jgi:hypothetical protein